MFYYPEVLRRHTGCFGTIWLAATAQSRLLRREYLGVDVPRTCAAVTLFVIGRGGWEVPPPPAGAPAPRCSLYLGALLQLGLARVYVRQCHLLLEETSTILERLHRAWRPLAAIDISPPRRAQLVPDSRALMEELESAPDPFFGLMAPALPQVEELLPLLEAIEAPPVAEAERLRLREAEEAPPPPEPEEVELPEVTPRELQLLLEAEPEELAPEPELPLPPPPPPAPPELAPPLPPMAPPPPRPRPPLRLDPQTQIGAERIRERLRDPRWECSPRGPAEAPQRRTAAELLSSPGNELIPEELRELWGRSFRPRPPPAPPLAPPTELPSELEVPRAALEPSLPSEVSLEPLEEEPSIPPLPAPPPEVLPELPEAPPIDLRRLILDHAQLPEGAELGAILGPDCPRPRVARAFALCLELCASGQLRLEQLRPFGPIRIKLRPPRQ